MSHGYWDDNFLPRFISATLIAIKYEKKKKVIVVIPEAFILPAPCVFFI